MINGYHFCLGGRANLDVQIISPIPIWVPCGPYRKVPIVIRCTPSVPDPNYCKVSVQF